MLRVLVVDDSEAMRRSIIDALRGLPDVECAEANNGASALQMFTAIRPAVVVTDIHMPIVDGLKLVRLIRADPRNVNLPIVVLSAQVAVADRERMMALGASAFLPKPLEPAALLETVRTLLDTAAQRSKA